MVLVTGVSGQLGAAFAARTAADPRVDRVLGVDTVAPGPGVAEKLRAVEFVRADIRNPLIAGVLATAAVDTVVHLSVSPVSARSRAALKERNVIGTMQLLAACQDSELIRRLVVKSTSAVYGAGSSGPAVHGEDSEPTVAPSSGFARDAVEIEGYVRGFGRRRPDVIVSMLRCATVVGPTTGSALARYLTLPVVPTTLGFDPRVQLVHESDVLEVLDLLLRHGVTTVNVAGDGVLLLSQLIRRSRRLALALPDAVAGLAARVGAASPSGRSAFLTAGVVMDTARLRSEVGYVPAYSTATAYEDFLAHQVRGQTAESPIARVARG